MRTIILFVTTLQCDFYILYDKFTTTFYWGGGGGGQGGLSLPLPVPFNPGSRPVFVGSCLFAIFSIAKFCTALRNFRQFLPLPATLRIPLPSPCSPASRTPPARFSPWLPLPCPPPLYSPIIALTIFTISESVAGS